MNYGIYSRSKLSRSKYPYSSIINNNGSGGNSFYSNTSFDSANGGYDVGGAMGSLKDFIGATEYEDGARGLVPAPVVGEQLTFLQGSGAWVDIPAYRWFKEWPTIGDPTGLSIDGDLNVTQTLSTLNLKVEGAAHFWELVIDEVKANGGQIIVSPSLFYVDHVGNVQTYYLDSHNPVYSRGGLVYPFRDFVEYRKRPDIWAALQNNNVTAIRAKRLYMKNDDETRRIFNECDVFDMLRCRTFNVQAGVYHDISNKDYWSFVLGTGEENFVDSNNRAHSAMYIDLAYSMKTADGKYIPLGSTLNRNGGWTVPEGWTPKNDIWELKIICQEMYDGASAEGEEYPEDEEFAQITDYVVNIRGIRDAISAMLGVGSSGTVSQNNNTQLGKQLAFLNDGTLPDDANNMAQLIMTGTFDDKDYNITYLPDEEELYSDMSYEILGIRSITKDGEDSDPDDTTSTNKNTTDWFFKHDYNSEEYDSFLFGYGTFKAGVEDSLACLGNLVYEERMNAIVISSTTCIDPELVPPSIAQYHLIDKFGLSISRFRMTTIAKNGNEFFGDFRVINGNKFFDIDEQINFYITDLETNLEKVGIHLDGEHSTIRVVGSIELHQHDDGNDDTLSVWDGHNNKRIEIIPREIPSKGSEELTISTSDVKYIDTVKLDWTANSSWIVEKDHKEGGILWHLIAGKWYSDYELWTGDAEHGSDPGIPKYKLHFNGRCYLGYQQAGSSISASNLAMTIDTQRTYLRANNKTVVPDYRNNPLYQSVQKISPIHVKLVYPSGRVIDGWTLNATCNFSEDGRIFNISYNGFVGGDGHVNESGIYYLEYDFDAYLYALVMNVEGKASPGYYFYGTAYLQGYVTLESLDDAGDTIYDDDMSNTRMLIGTNGLVFNGTNRRYFYAGTDGFELKWDDAKLSIDGENGFRENKLVALNYSFGDDHDHPNILEKKYSAVIMPFNDGVPNAGHGIMIPDPTAYGECRTLTVVSDYGSRIGCETGHKFRIYFPYLSPIIPDNMYGFKIIQMDTVWDLSSADIAKVPCMGVLTFISLNGSWYIQSGIITGLNNS